MAEGDFDALVRNQQREINELRDKRLELERDNQKYRQKLREVKGKLEAIGIDFNNPELPQADPKLSEELSAWKALNLSPAEAAEKLQKAQEAVSRLESLEAREAYVGAAISAKFDPEVFSDLATAKGLKVVKSKVTKDGKEVTEFAVEADGGKIPVEEFVRSNLSAYLPALKSEKEEGVPFADLSPGAKNTPKQDPVTLAKKRYPYVDYAGL